MRTIETEHSMDSLKNGAIIRTSIGDCYLLQKDSWYLLTKGMRFNFETLVPPFQLLWPTDPEPNEKLVQEHIQMKEDWTLMKGQIRELNQLLSEERAKNDGKQEELNDLSHELEGVKMDAQILSNRVTKLHKVAALLSEVIKELTT